MKIQKNVTHYVLVDDRGNRWRTEMNKENKEVLSKDSNGKQIATVTKKHYSTKANARRAMMAREK